MKWYKVLFSCHERRKLIYVRNGLVMKKMLKMNIVLIQLM